MTAAETLQCLDGFIDAFAPEVALRARQSLEHMRRRLPGAVALVYDNYNALAIAFSANEKQSGIIFSIALYPRWVSLFFAQGARLADPHNVLKGTGTAIRHVVLSDPGVIGSPEVEALIALALDRAVPPIDPTGEARYVIKSVSAKRRPRRPVAALDA